MEECVPSPIFNDEGHHTDTFTGRERTRSAFISHRLSVEWATVIRKASLVSVLAATLAAGIGCESRQGAATIQQPDSPAKVPCQSSKVRPLTNRTFEQTPERLAQGRYLVEGIGYCFACHGAPNLKSRGLPPIAGKEGSGFDFTALGYPGQIAPNITPDPETGAGNSTDDMIARAIREGVSHEGCFLDPAIMPYEFYRSMSDEDLAAIIVFIRSIPPVKNALPASAKPTQVVAPYAIPLYAPVPVPDLSTPVKRGAYLVQIGACQWCHTLRDANRQPLPGLEFGGGDLIAYAGGQATSANLTPDPSGISYYDEKQFVRTIRKGRVGAREISPIMPWWFFAHMTDDDLKAIFAYLRTLKPVHHRVDNTEPVSYCRVCRRKHGGGALN